MAKQINDLSQTIKKQESGEKARVDGAIMEQLISDRLKESNRSCILRDQIFQIKEIEANDVLHIESYVYNNHNKPDIAVKIIKKDSSIQTTNISLKSTFVKTQLAIHSVESFCKNMEDKNCRLPMEARLFLEYFVNSEPQITKNENLANAYSFSESERRGRFSLNEILEFDDQNTFEAFKIWTQVNAKALLRFLIIEGKSNESNQFADIIAFVSKKLDAFYAIGTDHLIDDVLTTCQEKDSWIIHGKDKKSSGITTLLLFDELISLQMKGSGKGNSYHNLQFNISGNKIRNYFKSKGQT